MRELLSAEYKLINPERKIFRGALIMQGLLNLRARYGAIYGALKTRNRFLKNKTKMVN